MQVDLTVVVTRKNADNAAKALRNLPNDLYQQAKITYRTPPTGGGPTKFVTYEDALKPIMVIGGKQAEQKRAQRHMGSNGAGGRRHMESYGD